MYAQVSLSGDLAHVCAKSELVTPQLNRFETAPLIIRIYLNLISDDR